MEQNIVLYDSQRNRILLATVNCVGVQESNVSSLERATIEKTFSKVS